MGFEIRRAAEADEMCRSGTCDEAGSAAPRKALLEIVDGSAKARKRKSGAEDMSELNEQGHR